MKYIFYVCFCRTAHGKNYWRIVGDIDIQGDLVYSVPLEAESAEEAEEIARGNAFGLDQWESDGTIPEDVPGLVVH